MKSVLTLLAVVSLVAGCTTVGKIDNAIQKSLPQICVGATTIHNTFVVFAEVGLASARTIRREAEAWKILEPLCVNPNQTHSITVLIAVGEAFTVISQAIKEVRNE